MFVCRLWRWLAATRPCTFWCFTLGSCCSAAAQARLLCKCGCVCKICSNQELRFLALDPEELLQCSGTGKASLCVRPVHAAIKRRTSCWLESGQLVRGSSTGKQLQCVRNACSGEALHCLVLRAGELAAAFRHRQIPCTPVCESIGPVWHYRHQMYLCQVLLLCEISINSLSQLLALQMSWHAPVLQAAH